MDRHRTYTQRRREVEKYDELKREMRRKREKTLVLIIFSFICCFTDLKKGGRIYYTHYTASVVYTVPDYLVKNKNSKMALGEIRDP